MADLRLSRKSAQARGAQAKPLHAERRRFRGPNGGDGESKRLARHTDFRLRGRRIEPGRAACLPRY